MLKPDSDPVVEFDCYGNIIDGSSIIPITLEEYLLDTSQNYDEWCLLTHMNYDHE